MFNILLNCFARLIQRWSFGEKSNIRADLLNNGTQSWLFDRYIAL